MAHLRPIHTEAAYDRTVKMMNALLDVTGEDEDHPYLKAEYDYAQTLPPWPDYS